MSDTRALVIPFHRYTPFYQDNYRILFEYWKKMFNLWKDEITTLYFIDSQNYLYKGEEDALRDQFHPAQLRVLTTNNFSHADNLNYVMPMITEDKILLMDMDTIVYKKGILNNYFGNLDQVDVFAMVERPDPGKVSRFSPYFFMITNNALHKVDPLNFDPEPPIHLDPLAKFTHRLLEKGITFVEAPDDRSTIQMQLNGRILKNRKLPYHTGVYHARNFNGGVHLVDSWNCDRENARGHINRVPAEELTRLFGWLWLINTYTIHKKRLEKDILEILAFKGIKESDWFNFLIEFSEYHSYLNI